MGARSFTYAEALPSQELRHWLDAHMHAFEFLGGVPHVLVPDNLKAAVTKANYYDPDLNRAYQDLAEHYGTVVIPARVRKPRDKSEVENAVLQVERWVLAPLRNERFFALADANRAIAARLTWLNDRALSKLDGTRRSLFEQLDKPVLHPLPTKRFEIPEWRVDVGVNKLRVAVLVDARDAEVETRGPSTAPSRRHILAVSTSRNSAFQAAIERKALGLVHH